MSPNTIALSFLKSNVISVFFMDFRDSNSGMSLATMSVFSITSCFPNTIGMSTFSMAVKKFPSPNW